MFAIGGYAVMKHSEPNNTKDLDLPHRVNAERADRSLARLGAPLGDVTVDDLLNPDLVYQVGIEPVRIDVRSVVCGLDFEGAWNRRDKMMYGGLEVPVLSIEDTSCANLLGTNNLAERQGFEPWIEFPLYTLSKRAPSTTRPSLRLRNCGAFYSIT